MLGLLMALCFVSHFNRASITSAGDERIMRQFGITPERMGVIYSAFLVVYTAFMVPGGWFIDRFGTRVALACMGVGSALFCAVTGGVGLGWVDAAHAWLALLCVRSAMGLMTTPLHPGAARAAGQWFNNGGLNLANGWITGASILAYAVVHPWFGGLMDVMDWPRAFLATGGATALLAGVWWWAAGRPTPAGHGPGTGESMEPAEEWSRSGLPWITLAYAAVGYFQYLFFYWLHYYFDSVVQVEKTTARLYAGLPNLAMAACMPLGGWWADRMRRRHGPGSARWVPGASMGAAAVLLLVALTAESAGRATVWFTASLGMLGLAEASFWGVVVRMGGPRGGLTASIMNMGGNGIGLLAPMLTPWIGRWLGWKWGIGAGAAVAIVGALCWVGVRPRDAGQGGIRPCSPAPPR